MNAIFGILLFVWFQAFAYAAEPISIEEFKKIDDDAERGRIIERAASEQKETLEKVDYHLKLVKVIGGEAALNDAKESATAEKRGLGDLEDVFVAQTQFWDVYMGRILSADEAVGMTHEQLGKVEEALTIKRDAVRKRRSVVHTLVFRLAASPDALTLAKQARKFSKLLRGLISWDGRLPKPPPITRAERTRVDARMDRYFERIKHLPAITPAQAQKERDDIADDTFPLQPMMD